MPLSKTLRAAPLPNDVVPGIVLIVSCDEVVSSAIAISGSTSEVLVIAPLVPTSSW
ncbi:Uncharacterised protein, partial [Mycoplasmopsis synoviae]